MAGYMKRYSYTHARVVGVYDKGGEQVTECQVATNTLHCASAGCSQ